MLLHNRKRTLQMLKENLQKIRRIKAWSRQELAEKAGINPSTIFNIETGRCKNPGHLTLMGIAKALDVTIEILCADDIAITQKIEAIPSKATRQQHLPLKEVANG